MLKKLFKYEFKDFLKIIRLVWFAILGIAVLASISLLLTSTLQLNPDDTTTLLLLSLFSGGTTTLLVGVCSALFLITTIMFVVRFYKSMLSNEGYLTHSLPIKTENLMNVKVLCGVLIHVINVLVVAVAFFIACLPTIIAHLEIGDFLKGLFLFIKEMYSALGVGYGIALTVEGVLFLVVTLFVSFLYPVLCMSIGQRFKNRVFASILIYVGIQWGLQIILSFLWFVLMIVSLSGGLPQIDNLAFLPTITVLGAIAIVLEAAGGIVCYFVSRKMLTKKLNLV